MPSRHPVLVDSHAAAAAVNVAPATIRKWLALGYLTKYGTDRQGRSLVDLGEVYRCAAARHASRHRRWGSGDAHPTRTVGDRDR